MSRWQGKTPRKVAVLGAGSWGTAFAQVVAQAAALRPDPWQTLLWGRSAEAMDTMARRGRNEKYFPGLQLPDSLTYTSDLVQAVTGADIVVLALPSQVLRSQLEVLAPSLEADALLLSLAKGLEQGTGLRMSQVVEEVVTAQLASRGANPEELAQVTQRVAVLSGPNLAKEIVAGQPTTSVVAARQLEVADYLAQICVTDYFRPYTNSDLVGVEVGGLVKNIIALCVGICEGRQYGDNSKASVMTRGLAETTRLAKALGGRAETMSGLAGMGDLIATCSSPLSRNHTAGRLLAEGVSPQDLPKAMSQTAEAVKSAPVLAQLARRLGVEMPITEAVVAVLEGQMTVDQLAPALLGRRLKSEEP